MSYVLVVGRTLFLRWLSGAVSSMTSPCGDDGGLECSDETELTSEAAAGLPGMMGRGGGTSSSLDEFSLDRNSLLVGNL